MANDSLDEKKLEPADVNRIPGKWGIVKIKALRSRESV